MKIAIAANESQVKSHVDPHFGRCEWYCLYDTETKNIEFIENTARNQSGNSGCEAVTILLDKGVNIVVAGRFGSKVVEVFRSKNIQMIVPENVKTIHEIINQI